MTVLEGIVREIPGVGVLEFVETERRRDYWFIPEGGQRRRRVPSVTAITGAVWPKPALLRWYATHGAGATALLAASSERGKAVHKFVEDYFAAGSTPALDDYMPEAWPYIVQALRFLQDTDPEPVALEQIVVHPEHGYAGRFDFRANIEGRSTLLDFKTNEKGNVYAEAHLQAHAYAEADARCGSEPVEARLIVGISASAYRVVAGADCADVWKRALAFYKAKRTLENTLARDARADFVTPEEAQAVPA